MLRKTQLEESTVILKSRERKRQKTKQSLELIYRKNYLSTKSFINLNKELRSMSIGAHNESILAILGI